MTSSRPLRFLVVAEQDDMRTVFCWLLNQAFDATEIFTARSAGEAAVDSRESLDCIFLDGRMPGSDEALKSILAESGTELIPAVVLGGDEVAERLADPRSAVDCLQSDQLTPSFIRQTVRRMIEVASLKWMLAEQGRELERLQQARDSRQQDEIADATDPASRSIDGAYHAPEPVRGGVAVTAGVGLIADSPDSAPVVVDAPQRSILSHSGERLVSPGLVTQGFDSQSAADEELAQRVQKDLMPAGSPYLEGFDVAGLSIPAAATGGDYYDYLPVGDDLLSITIGECSGRGLGPAMLMASLRAYLRVLAQNSIDLSTIVSHSNSYITEDVGEEEFLVTLMLVQIDQLTRTMRYCSAGHQGYLIRRGGEVEILHSTGMPMGLQPETVIPEAAGLRLRTGDAVLLTTDGLQKMESPSGEKFGMERVLDLVQENRDLPARMIIQYLRKACLEFAGTAAQGDDITMVLVKCDGSDGF